MELVGPLLFMSVKLQKVIFPEAVRLNPDEVRLYPALVALYPHGFGTYPDVELYTLVPFTLFCPGNAGPWALPSSGPTDTLGTMDAP